MKTKTTLHFVVVVVVGFFFFAALTKPELELLLLLLSDDDFADEGLDVLLIPFPILLFFLVSELLLLLPDSEINKDRLPPSLYFMNSVAKFVT